MPCLSARMWVFFAAITGAGCGHSSSSAGDSVTCAQPAGCAQPGPGTTQLSSPSVSFASDVVPLFETSCATSTLCHQGLTGSAVPSMSLLFLGTGMGAAADSPSIYSALPVPSHELPSMSYVTPGDPGTSYLMHKMDGDQCQFESTCAIMPASTTPCGAVMPIPCALADDQRDVVRRWIAQGALDN